MVFIYKYIHRHKKNKNFVILLSISLAFASYCAIFLFVETVPPPEMMPLKSDQPMAISSEKTSAEEPKKLKPCCACPETKRVRDAW